MRKTSQTQAIQAARSFVRCWRRRTDMIRAGVGHAAAAAILGFGECRAGLKFLTLVLIEWPALSCASPEAVHPQIQDLVRTLARPIRRAVIDHRRPAHTNGMHSWQRALAWLRGELLNLKLCIPPTARSARARRTELPAHGANSLQCFVLLG
jgi:hypothetical protein